jgi:sRNA-binding regulator protein Hfq
MYTNFVEAILYVHATLYIPNGTKMFALLKHCEKFEIFLSN